MVSAATKRKRRVRENRTAALIEQARAQTQAEQKALGTTVSASVANETLFKLDRKGTSKEALKQKQAADAIRNRQEVKRAARKAPRALRSEYAANAPTPMEDVSFIGCKKRQEIGPVEKRILRTRSFDKPEGHIGNTSAPSRAAERHANGKEDIWNSETAERVKAEISERRKEMLRKRTRRIRRGPAVIFPDPGLSVNPSYEHHQDKLGEALAKVVDEEDNAKRIKDKLSYDPALLAKDGEDEITGMKVDAKALGSGEQMVAPDDGAQIVEEPEQSEEPQQPDGLGEPEPISRAAPGRKSRAERNKEKRKRAMKSDIIKKKRAAQQAAKYEQISTIAEQASEEADKLNGVTKRMMKKNRPKVRSRRDKPLMVRVAKQKVRNESAVEPFLFSNELADSLRATKMQPHNPLLQDRMLSFERRGIIEPPSVLPKEMWRMQQEEMQEAMRERKLPRNGRHSTSNISYWKERARKR